MGGAVASMHGEARNNSVKCGLCGNTAIRIASLITLHGTCELKILLFGKDGNLGWELQRSLAPLGELVATSRNTIDYCGDLANAEGIAQTVATLKPDVIVNAAAYTAVDKAESDQHTAYAVNAIAPGVLAQAAQRVGALLVHYSTDYVFDGSGAAKWRESDLAAPLNVYGSTKLEGENAIIASGCRHLIFRTSWVYATRGVSFAKTMLRLVQERDQLNVINDQFGAPTGVELLSDVTAHCIRSVQHAASSDAANGIFHLAAGGETTWHAYASLVAEVALQAGMPVKVNAMSIKPVPTTSYPTPARRPLNSRLDTSRLQSTFGLTLPDWQTGVVRTLNEIIESGPAKSLTSI